jgi:hypothetical protein
LPGNGTGYIQLVHTVNGLAVGDREIDAVIG